MGGILSIFGMTFAARPLGSFLGMTLAALFLDGYFMILEMALSLTRMRRELIWTYHLGKLRSVCVRLETLLGSNWYMMYATYLKSK